MEDNKQYRDVYTVVELYDYDDTPYANSQIVFEEDAALIQTSDYCAEIGIISKDVEAILEVVPLLEQLRKDNVAPQNCEKAIFVPAEDLAELSLMSGIVVAVQNDLVLVYCGTGEFDDDYGIDVEVTYEDDCTGCDCRNMFKNCNQLLEIPEVTYPETRYGITDEGQLFLQELADSLVEQIVSEADHCVCPKEREEEKTMDNLFGNLGFGKLQGNRFKISMNGIAVAQSNGKYVVYNKDNNEFVDVTNMLLDIKDAMFLLPAVEVGVGDTVFHENKPYFVVSTANNEIKAVDYETCTQTVLIPKSTMFGIKYFTKVFSLFGDNFASAGDLFSNPMMLMALMEGKNSDLTQIMLMNSLGNGDLGTNPMALAMMLKGDKSDDSLSTIALMSMFNNGTNPFAPKKKDTKKNTTQDKA